MPDDPEIFRLQRDVIELRNLVAVLTKQLRDVWPPRRYDEDTGGSTLEYVTLTQVAGSGGDATNQATFTYTFTDKTGQSHPGVAPTHRRINAALKATTGIYDSAADKLIWTDEIPNAGGCT